MSNLTVGQVLYQPPSQWRRQWSEHTVTKIGRIWAQLGTNTRCTIDTLTLDTGGYSPIQLYVNKEVYEAEQTLYKAWRELGDATRGRMPEGLTVELIEQARALLKVPA